MERFASLTQALLTVSNKQIKRNSNAMTAGKLAVESVRVTHE
jgi:hypothetical protein